MAKVLPWTRPDLDPNPEPPDVDEATLIEARFSLDDALEHLRAIPVGQYPELDETLADIEAAVWWATTALPQEGGE